MQTKGDRRRGDPYGEAAPIGSRGDYLESFDTDQGIYLRTGCFFGTLKQFTEQVKRVHGNSDHGRAYAKAIRAIKAMRDC